MVNDIPIELSGSVGIAFYPVHGSDANTLFQHADVAMYLAKQFRRNAIYNPSDDPYNQQHVAILGGIRKAVERNELVLHFQPKIHLLTGKTTGVEALSDGIIRNWDFFPRIALFSWPSAQA